jgi:hypothetical protein
MLPYPRDPNTRRRDYLNTGTGGTRPGGRSDSELTQSKFAISMGINSSVFQFPGNPRLKAAAMVGNLNDLPQILLYSFDYRCRISHWSSIC